jgi:hypothetical protein
LSHCNSYDFNLQRGRATFASGLSERHGWQAVWTNFTLEPVSLRAALEVE